MEDLLTQIHRDASPAKFSNLRKLCKDAVDFLQDEEKTSSAPAYQLRELCLCPIQLALESHNSRLITYAIGGLQRILQDERFHSNIEAESEDRWLPMQILNTVAITPTLSEDVQVEIMKVLLNMTFSTTWCMNAKVITRISELFINMFMTNKQKQKDACLANFTQILGAFYQRQEIFFEHITNMQVSLEVYARNSPGSVKPAVRATLVQLLSSFAEKLQTAQALNMQENAENVVAEFSMQDNKQGALESLTKDIVAILEYLCNKLAQFQRNVSMLPLLLEGIYAILSNIPPTVRKNAEFIEILWKSLCPSLIAILGNPKADKSITSQKTGNQEEVGRGSGCTTSAPSVLGPAAKTVYNIAIELVRLVGSVDSLRPVLESVFHRMLLYPPPQHRHDAVKAIKELFTEAHSVANLAGPAEDGNEDVGHKKKTHSDTSLLKLMVDAIQECCHCNDSAVCITSVNCMDVLLKSIEELSKGEGMHADMAEKIVKKYSNAGTGDYRIQKHMVSDDSSKLPMNTNNTNSNISDVQEESESRKKSQEKAVYNGDVLDVNLKQLDLSHPDVPSSDSDVPKSDPDVPHSDVPTSPFWLSKHRLEAVEKASARVYVEAIEDLLPSLFDMYSVAEVDIALQKFASDFCANQQTREHEQDSAPSVTAILNADGIYVTTFSVLSLNLKLIRNGYYENKDKPFFSEKAFIDGTLGNSLLLYLSTTFLAEVYQYVIATNMLAKAGYKDDVEGREMTVIKMITDLDGLHNSKIGGQMMCDCQETTHMEADQEEDITHVAGPLFARALLTLCWDGLLDVLSVLLDGKSSCGITSSLALMLGTDGAKEETYKAREAICMSLDGLQRASRLACTLGLQNRCGGVFLHLANASCVLEEENKPAPPQDGKPNQSSKPKPAKLHTAHVLSLDQVLNMGLEMGSHSADCWKHVFRCCTHVSELEHTYFSSSSNSQSKLQKMSDMVNPPTVDPLSDPDLITPPVLTPVPVTPNLSVSELIRESGIEAGWDSAKTGGGVLSSTQSSQVLCALSQQVDRLFDGAASNLTMESLMNFLYELGKSSHNQLFAKHKYPDEPNLGSKPTNTLLIYRLGDVMLNVLRSGRPLYHIMRAWAVVSQFFVEAACHKEGSISKKAVSCLHECVTTLLNTQPEMPHFHFNEALCKPFENLLCLEMCDGDMQDQIACSICELVEGCAGEIKSGWRPLFGALRAVKIEYTMDEEVNEARQRHVAAVLDVFEIFLDTDNVLVFTNAAVDCILCLLKYVRGPGEFNDFSDDDSDSGSDVAYSSQDTENLCLPALKYLKKCCTLFASMWNMPACPIFNGAHRIQMNRSPQCIDPVIPNMDLEAFQKHFQANHSHDDKQGDVVNQGSGDHDASTETTSVKICQMSSDGFQPVSASKEVKAAMATATSEEDEDGSAQVYFHHSDEEPDEDNDEDEESPPPKPHYAPVTLESLDNHTGILHVWFLVYEGLAGAVSACPKSYQPQTLEMLFELLRSTAKTPGADFSVYCVNHLLLPMLQSWLRKGSTMRGYWDTSGANFKQTCGLCTDLVVEYIVQFVGSLQNQSGVEFMLKQLYDVLIECIALPVETVSRLGCSCVRHTVLSGGPLFTEEMWHITAAALQRSFDVTMYSTRQLMTLFEASSDNFYGDIGQVKVAARRDSSALECERMRQLAKQVFLLDSQQHACDPNPSHQAIDEDKSFVFLLYPPGFENSLNPEHIVMRVPMRNIVVGLLSHQLLLQTMGCVLLQGSRNVTRNEKHLLPGSPTHTRRASQEEDALIKEVQLPGLLKFMSTRNAAGLLQCLHNSYNFACEFDSRPGLKFLIQKVISSSVAANLYKQAGVAMTFYIHALLEICAHQENLSIEKVKTVIQDTEKKLNATILADETISKSKERRNSQAYSSTLQIQKHVPYFIETLYQAYSELCEKYVHLLLDKAGTSSADRIADQPLFFLLAQPDDVPSLKREKKLEDIVAEKLLQTKEGFMATTATAVQDTETELGDIGTKPDHSPDESHARSGEPEDKVYTVATDKTIQSLMSTYKKRKQQHSMPSFVKLTKQSKTKRKTKSKDIHIDHDVESQQHLSIMKDADAHTESWTEMLCTVFQLIQALPDHQFQAFLPLIFDSTNQLVCHTESSRLKEMLAQWLHKLGHLYHIAIKQ